MSCEHRKSDIAIYLIPDLEHWNKMSKKHDVIDIFTSVISHETIHLVLTKRVGDIYSVTLDSFFGDGHDYKREYHGLCNFNAVFYKLWNHVKGRRRRK